MHQSRPITRRKRKASGEDPVIIRRQPINQPEKNTGAAAPAQLAADPRPVTNEANTTEAL